MLPYEIPGGFNYHTANRLPAGIDNGSVCPRGGGTLRGRVLFYRNIVMGWRRSDNREDGG